jgi:hypothetical protein
MVKDPGYEQAKDVKKRHTSLLMLLENVVGVGVSKKLDQDSNQSRWVIVVYVKNKLPPDQIDADNMIPSTIEGVLTDVVEIGQPIPYETQD